LIYIKNPSALYKTLYNPVDLQRFYKPIHTNPDWRIEIEMIGKYEAVSVDVFKVKMAIILKEDV